MLLWSEKVQLIKPSWLLIPTQNLGIHKDTLGLYNSLDILKELTENSYTFGYRLLNERMEVKMGQGKMCIGQSPRKF